MASSSDTATQLMTFVAGPSILGLAAVVSYVRKALGSSERDPTKGWLSLGAGVLLVSWLCVFLTWAAPTMLRSWSAGGDPKVPLVLLSASWFVAVGMLVTAVLNAPQLARYLSESYRTDEGPWPVRAIRWLLKRR